MTRQCYGGISIERRTSAIPQNIFMSAAALLIEFQWAVLVQVWNIARFIFAGSSMRASLYLQRAHPTIAGQAPNEI
jgi:hypothetical protein